MTTPLAELLAALPAINDPAEPFTYTVEGSTIVGSWDIVKAQVLYPTELETIDKKYSITVEFNEDKGTYEFNERKTSSGASVTSGGLSFGASTFSGKSSSKEFSFEFGGIKNDKDGISAAPLVYSFETSRIKDPLFGFLEQHGWKRKKGLLGGLFNR